MHTEIERKWMVSGWPEGLTLLYEQRMRQGYVSVLPTVRIREEAGEDGTEYILCFKSDGGIARKELEFPIAQEHFAGIEELIGYPLIAKVRRTYALPDGHKLEVNHVDEGQPTEFWYAEVEYADILTAETWQSAACGLAAYLNDEVTGQPGQSMGAYWQKTRPGTAR